MSEPGSEDESDIEEKRVQVCVKDFGDYSLPPFGLAHLHHFLTLNMWHFSMNEDVKLYLDVVFVFGREQTVVIQQS